MESWYMRLLTPVTCVRLKMLKPSASNSSFAFSLIVNRREMRKSTYLIEGEWKKLFGNNANRSHPFRAFNPARRTRTEHRRCCEGVGRRRAVLMARMDR